MSKTETLTATQVARELHFYLNYVYELIRTGKLPATKKNGNWIIAVSELNDWKKGRRKK